MPRHARQHAIFSCCACRGWRCCGCQGGVFSYYPRGVVIWLHLHTRDVWPVWEVPAKIMINSTSVSWHKVWIECLHCSASKIFGIIGVVPCAATTSNTSSNHDHLHVVVISIAFVSRRFTWELIIRLVLLQPGRGVGFQTATWSSLRGRTSDSHQQYVTRVDPPGNVALPSNISSHHRGSFLRASWTGIGMRNGRYAIVNLQAVGEQRDGATPPPLLAQGSKVLYPVSSRPFSGVSTNQTLNLPKKLSTGLRGHTIVLKFCFLVLMVRLPIILTSLLCGLASCCSASFYATPSGQLTTL